MKEILKTKVFEGDTVRLLSYPKEDVDAYANVKAIDNDKIWLANLNMPWQGTISAWFTREEFEEITPGLTF
jgi:hypothetical protein